MLIVEQGSEGTSYGGRLADKIQLDFFDWLDQPVQRVHGRIASPTISKVLERAAYAGKSETVAGVIKSMAAKGEPLDPALITGAR